MTNKANPMKHNISHPSQFTDMSDTYMEEDEINLLDIILVPVKLTNNERI